MTDEARPGLKIKEFIDGRFGGKFVMPENLNTMMKKLVPIFQLLALCTFLGCVEPEKDGFYTASSGAFSKTEARAVALSKAAVEKADGRPIDARYRVSPVAGGFNVHVKYVAGYNHGKPIFVAGGFCEVFVSDTWTVVKILPGA